MSGFWGLVVKPGSKPTPMRATPGEMVMVLKQVYTAPASPAIAWPLDWWSCSHSLTIRATQLRRAPSRCTGGARSQR
eukprot:scaffold118773_cov28-Tisochrysis_lutea.AAC.5